MSELSATTSIVEQRRDSRGRMRALELPLHLPIWETVAVVALCPLLLAAAIWNGFPLIFYDTGAYMLQSFGDKFVPERSPVFSLFILFAGGGISLWLVAVLQALMASFVMVEGARALAPRINLPVLLSIGGGLVLLTGLPWYVGQIEPDAFTPLVVLTVYLLAFEAKRLGWRRCALLVGISAFAIAAHPSHLAIAAGLMAALALYRLIILWKRAAWPQARLLAPLLALVLGLGTILSANYHYTRHLFVSRAGPVFMFSRMLQDGVVQKLLDETCPSSDYMLCRYRKQLPHRADKWLWGPGTLFVKLHRFIGTEKESERIVHDSLVRYPLLNAKVAARDALQQFTLFYTGDQIEPQQWILFTDFHTFIPDQLPAYSAARQQKGKLHFGVINAIQVPGAFGILVLLFGALGWAVHAKQRKETCVLGFILVALVGNAIVCGAFSNPHARYQSRLMWVPAFALALLAVDRRNAALQAS
jgi:hypothetical protein